MRKPASTSAKLITRAMKTARNDMLASRADFQTCEVRLPAATPAALCGRWVRRLDAVSVLGAATPAGLPAGERVSSASRDHHPAQPSDEGDVTLAGELLHLPHEAAGVVG